MATICATPIKARVMRLVKVDTCGVPVTGASSAVVISSGFIQVKMSPEYEEGEEFLLKTANGDACVNQKDPSFLKRVGLNLEFCQVDPDAIIVVTGERLITGGAPVTGTGVVF